MSYVADRARIQDATAWTTTPNSTGGSTFGAPQAIKVRWEDRTEQFMSILDKKEVVSNAVVSVGLNLKVGDYLYLGTSVATDPSTVAGAYRIRRFDKIPNLRNLLVDRRAYL